MKRAFLLEMTIFRDYARQLVGLGLLVSLCIGLGMQTPLAMPATLTCMFFMMVAPSFVIVTSPSWLTSILSMPTE